MEYKGRYNAFDPLEYGGQGTYIEGNQKQTFSLLYKKLLELLYETGPD